MHKRILRPEYEVAYAEITALLKRHADKLTAAELLGIAANIVGKILALQDQRTMTPDRAMAIIAANIEEGNQQVVRELAQGAPAGRA